MKAEQLLHRYVQEGLKSLYQFETETISFQKTRKEFEGDFTLVTFAFTKPTRKSPDQIGTDIGNYLKQHAPEVEGFNVVKGFLNIVLKDSYWLTYFGEIKDRAHLGRKEKNSSGRTIMVEYSSPNTNKPLHLGHVRNILLGFSVAKILEANGHKVIKAKLVNDRGIHISKSMLAWKKAPVKETPESSGIKGDHLVGKYYVEFDKTYKKEIGELVAAGTSKEEAEKKAPSIVEAQQMLQHWEQGDKETVELWKKMNDWVYKGFDKTYKVLGVNFDKVYYESNTYLLGKELIQEGLKKGVFYKKENGSVAIDLSKEGLDEKIVLRSDGTSVYITQDLGTAIERFKEFSDLNQLIYTVGNEQDYHFKVLFKILEKLGYDWAKECYHLSYGMVELPEGKMKSREGTVVDADDLLEEMYRTAEETTKELGKVEDFSADELSSLFRTVSLGALKYFILKVDPKKKMLFDPKESIDFNGHTGPFIQYTHARIKSVLRKAESSGQEGVDSQKSPVGSGQLAVELNSLERELVKWLYDFEGILTEAGATYSPALVANYVYELTKFYNRFYHECPILKEEDASKRQLRIKLSKSCAAMIENCMDLLGIQVPERM